MPQPFDVNPAVPVTKEDNVSTDRSNPVVPQANGITAQSSCVAAQANQQPQNACALIGGMCRVVWPVILISVLMAVIAAMLRNHLLNLCEWINKQPIVISVFISMVLFVLWVVCFLPTTVLELGMGFIFGAWGGGLVNALGKFAAGTAAFLIARHCAQGYVMEKIVKKTPLLMALSRRIAENEWFTCFLVLFAYFNYSVKCYSLGVFDGLRLHVFLCANICTGLPLGLVGAYVGASLKTLTEAGEKGMSPFQIATLAIGLTACFVLLVIVGVVAGRELRRLSGTVVPENTGALEGNDGSAVRLAHGLADSPPEDAKIAPAAGAASLATTSASLAAEAASFATRDAGSGPREQVGTTGPNTLTESTK